MASLPVLIVDLHHIVEIVNVVKIDIVEIVESDRDHGDGNIDKEDRSFRRARMIGLTSSLWRMMLAPVELITISASSN